MTGAAGRHHQVNLRTSGGNRGMISPPAANYLSRRHCVTLSAWFYGLAKSQHFSLEFYKFHDGIGFYMTIFPGLELLGFIGCIILLCPEQENCIKCLCWRFRVCFMAPGRVLGWHITPRLYELLKNYHWSPETLRPLKVQLDLQLGGGILNYTGIVTSVHQINWGDSLD